MRTLLSFLGPLRSPVVVACAALMVNASAFGGVVEGIELELDHGIERKRLTPAIRNQKDSPSSRRC